MSNLLKKVQNFNIANDIWQPNSKIVLGISGGPDSSCLLDIFYRLSLKYPLKLHLAHVNYGLRGADSARDETLVRKIAERHNLPLDVLQVTKIKKGNLENELRDIRYAFFNKIRRNNNFDIIAVAHTLDDQVETMLMHVLRGAGLNGMKSMQFRKEHIVRPLLGITKKEIAEYLRKNRLPYRIDKTNDDTDLFRNRIRHKLIPYLEKNFNPALRKTLFSASINVAGDYDFITKTTDSLFSKLVSRNKGFSFSRKKFLTCHPTLQKGLLRKIIQQKNAGVKDLTSNHILELIKAIHSQKNKSQSVILPGLKLTRKGDKVVIL